MRIFRPPTNPRTEAQLNARSNFISSIGGWHALGDTLKAEFNNFAANFFKPKYPVAGVLYSGFNAYVSCENQLINALNSLSDTVTITGGTYTPTVPAGMLTESPRSGMSSDIVIQNIGPGGGEGTAQIVVHGSIFNSQTNTLNFDVRPSTGYTVTNYPVFKDPVSNKFTGILIMASLPQHQNQQFVKAPKYTLLAATPIIGTITPAAPGTELSFDVIIPAKRRKFEFIPDTIVELNYFLYNELGQTAFLNSDKITVQ